MPLLASIDTARSANDKRLHSHRCVDAYYLGAEHARHSMLRGRFLPARVVRSFTDEVLQDMLANKELERWTAGEVAAMNDQMKSLAPGAVAVGFSNLTHARWNAAWAHSTMMTVVHYYLMMSPMMNAIRARRKKWRGKGETLSSPVLPFRPAQNSGLRRSALLCNALHQKTLISPLQ